MLTVFDTEEVQQIRDLARKFAQERVAPGYLERERTGTFDFKLMREMGELGLIAPELPEEYGGMGMEASIPASSSRRSARPISPSATCRCWPRSTDRSWRISRSPKWRATGCRA
jgi:alkylation response protein AidB-like acyl-CoA dehydrogenase